MCKCYVPLLLISTVCFTTCFGILGETQQESKPGYTSGIKTVNWRNPNKGYTYHNYSKVSIHNKPSSEVQYFVTQTEKTVKVYPVYNGHSYGQRVENKGQMLQESSNLILQGNKSEENHRNRTIYKRKIEYKVLEVYEKCPKEATGQFVYVGSCNQFLNCWKGRGEPQNCAPGTLFNPKTLECDFPNKVECVTGPRQNLMDLREQKSVSQVSCPENFSGLIPNYTDCSKFINCNHGHAVSMDCPPGTLFDINQNICDFPYKSLCFNGETGKNYQVGSQNQNYQGQYTTSQHTVDSKLDFGSNTQGCSGSGYNCQWNSRINEQTTGINVDNSGRTYTTIPRGCNPSNGNCGQAGTIINHRPSNQYGHSSTNTRGCNPAIQNCENFIREQLTEFSHNSGSAVSGSGIYSSSTRGCNPATQNCNQLGIDTNYEQTTGYGQSSGHSLNIPNNCNPALQNCRPFGITGCNPATQNCDRLGTTTNYDHTNNYQSNCNPAIQNCGNIRTTINYGQTTTRGCNPSIQNCEKFTGYTGTTIQSGQSGHSYDSNCNPTYQNCNQNQANTRYNHTGTTIHANQFGQNRGSLNYGSDHSLGYVQTGDEVYPGYGSVKTNTHKVYTTTNGCNPTFQNCGHATTNFQQSNTGTYTTLQRCNPAYHNCGQTRDQYGSSTISNQNHQGVGIPNYNSFNAQGNSRTTNYNKICNIGDTNCHTQTSQTNTEYGQLGHNHAASAANVYDTRKNLEPKCPQGFQGITKHPTDCKKFLNCANGITYIQDCAPGTLFNPKIGNCDFPYNVNCQNTQDSYTGVNEEKHTHNLGNREDNVLEESAETTTVNQYFNRDRYPWTPSKPTGNYYQSTTIKYIESQNIDEVTEGPNPIQTNNNLDYIDVFNPNEKSFDFNPSSTPKSTNSWPPPFPTGNEFDDYDFEYDDGAPVTIEPDNIFRATHKKSNFCSQDDFHCKADQCIAKNMVCDGVRDCDNGKDEYGCDEYVGRFSVSKHNHLQVMEKQKWINISSTTCALLCIQNTQFNCRSFNYRRTDRTCFLSDVNVGLTGALRSNYLFDYFEQKAGTVICTDRSKYFECTNKKCILKSQICDGFDDCEDRGDEKNCRKEDLGYSLKLVGSNEKNEGTIEVTAFGKTGYVCDDQFGIKDANVVCKELGFELGAAEVKGQAFYNKNLSKNTLYMMDDVDCYGNESSLIDCDFSGWGVHNCGDMEAVGVVCKTPQEQCGYGNWRCDTGNECIPNSFICDGVFDCTDNSDEYDTYCEAPTEVRLVNGSSYNQGRLEIRHHGVWGTVCDDDFNEDAAKVVCKHLGFKGKSVVKKDGYFGSGDGPIWLDQVSCYGNETKLEACTHWNWGEHNCDHSEDVGVVCSNDMQEIDVQRNSKYTGGTKSPGTKPGLKIEKCGFRKDNQFLENDLIHARVVSGTKAQKGDYPWQAAIRVKVKEKSAHWCGAVILSNQWVVTAAHCLQGYAKGAYIIVAGEYNTDEDEGTEQQKYIEEFFIHERFRKGHKMNNDIALIKLKGSGFILNQDIQPICLPDTDAEYKDLNCTISGFGSVKTGTSGYSHDLMAAWIPTHSDEVCKMPHIYGTALTEGMFCAGFLDGGVDACDGDSGGPLACLDRGVFTLYGITSWGQHCGYANKPGVYVKVAYYRQWIDDIINKHS